MRIFGRCCRPYDPIEKPKLANRFRYRGEYFAAKVITTLLLPQTFDRNDSNQELR
jgi:hypothetical protein